MNIMSKFSKISISLFIVLFFGLSFFGFNLFRERNAATQTENEEIPNDEQTMEEELDAIADDSTSLADEDFVDNSAVDSSDDPEKESVEIEKNNFLDVSKNDCENKCKDFTDPDDLKYCQQICGLAATKKDVQEKSGCDLMQDLEKDYCLKDLAITKKDASICAQINDTNILKTCKNRIAQDMLESQKL
ncbi:MAG: hypothetical protein US25_C0060G0001 [Candidatus Moranbacteria bacterium GW2011_GWE1_36_7]|nr:MAG: hypothetical protein UR99_C0004G0023 [Candidatus Moranbacteria bacterium GW2011_GWD2_36_12]KKQ06933.1 MAG: hypothetical protein US16_C0006G0023 [Candidatus Moranbacteria bacterium GW2011_GWE2_36_40]KKQ12209.1 MAG: hypothetical protein US25_C0060G0001 [Candidatus Moranbacteria bacterium GW2011_GWE1_36_7]